jgi:hypothetical protein
MRGSSAVWRTSERLLQCLGERRGRSSRSVRRLACTNSRRVCRLACARAKSTDTKQTSRCTGYGRARRRPVCGLSLGIHQRPRAEKAQENPCPGATHQVGRTYARRKSSHAREEKKRTQDRVERLLQVALLKPNMRAAASRTGNDASGSVHAKDQMRHVAIDGVGSIGVDENLGETSAVSLQYGAARREEILEGKKTAEHIRSSEMRWCASPRSARRVESAGVVQM